VPGEKVNTLGKGMMQELLTLLGEIETRSEVRAIVLRSAKPDNFIAGADIKDFTTIRSSLEGETLSRQGQSVLDRLEALKVPVVAAIHGSCMGGGLETVLACDYRVASDHPKTSLGLPEVNLGIIPGMGGTQRLPRLVGLRTALDLILTGRALKATRASRPASWTRSSPSPSWWTWPGARRPSSRTARSSHAVPAFRSSRG
jgi:3-hydroxyacyl-CoA dehydrogenase/enoyl-CoA hydratase/3-hydroxybutyryl-CoA epimerase